MPFFPSLRLLKLKIEGKTIWTENLIDSFKIEVKIHAEVSFE